MCQPTTSNKQIFRNRVIHWIVFVFTAILITLNCQTVYANTLLPTTYRVSVASDKFSGTSQVAAAFNLGAASRIRARRLELVVGTTSSSYETRPFVSFGPVWRLTRFDRRLFVELGFSPTFFAGSSFNNRDIGGNLHFTSSANVGLTLGARRVSSLSIRVQHTSNGGLNATNPGMDMIGINFTFNLET